MKMSDDKEPAELEDDDNNPFDNDDCDDEELTELEEAGFTYPLRVGSTVID
jgi:hypothetical protein